MDALSSLLPRLHREELPLEVLRLMVSRERLIKSPAAREARAS